MSETNKTIAQKMADLDGAVDWFDSEDFELEKAFERFEQAQALAQDIETQLANMKNEIEVLKTKFDKTA